MKIGFIGLGHLGKAMAGRLISEGLEVTVWNRTPAKAVDLGVPVAESPARLIQKVDTLIINLFDSRAVKSVFFKKDGLIQGGLTNKTLIDTSTNHGEEVLFFHEILKSQGGHVPGSAGAGQRGPRRPGTIDGIGQRGPAHLRAGAPVDPENRRKDLLPGRARPGHQNETGEQPPPGHFHGGHCRGPGARGGRRSFQEGDPGYPSGRGRPIDGPERQAGKTPEKRLQPSIFRGPDP